MTLIDNGLAQICTGRKQFGNAHMRRHTTVKVWTAKTPRDIRRAMVLALRDRGITVEQQVGMKVHFRDRPVGIFRADLVVARTVLVELKALPTIERDHVAQTLNALRATGLQVGLILNFGPKAQIKRVILTRTDEAPVQL